jgi:hypothetical protein
MKPEDKHEPEVIMKGFSNALPKLGYTHLIQKGN